MTFEYPEEVVQERARQSREAHAELVALRKRVKELENYIGSSYATEFLNEVDIWRDLAALIYDIDSTAVNKNQRTTAKLIFFKFLYRVGGLPGNDHLRLSPIEAGHQHEPSSFLVSCGACLEDANHRFHGQQDEHNKFVNEILNGTTENYDCDDSAEEIAIRYVRDLEWIRNKAIVALLQVELAIYGISTVTERYAKLARYEIIERGRLTNEALNEIRAKRELIVNDDTQKLQHVHGDGSECFPGCPAYEVAMAYIREVNSEIGVPDELPDKAFEVRMKRLAQRLLDKGEIFR